MDDVVEDHYGPALQALLPRQRGFVKAVVALGRNGIKNFAEAARIAGYSDTGNGAKVIGSKLSNDPRVQAAIFEEAMKRINLGASLVATPVVIEIALDRKAKKSDRLRAAEMLFNRGGMPALTEHKVTVEHKQPAELLALAAHLAKELGVDEQRLLGINRDAAKVLDGEFVEVKP